MKDLITAAKDACLMIQELVKIHDPEFKLSTSKRFMAIVEEIKKAEVARA